MLLDYAKESGREKYYLIMKVIALTGIRVSELRYIVRMEEAHFHDFVQSLLALQNTEDQEVRKEQVESMLQNEYHIPGRITITGVNNWYGSHTAEAFSVI